MLFFVAARYFLHPLEYYLYFIVYKLEKAPNFRSAAFECAAALILFYSDVFNP